MSAAFAEPLYSVPTDVSVDGGTGRELPVRSTCTVVVGTSVDGTVQRTPRGPDKRQRTRLRTFTVRADVLAKAHEVCRPGEHLVFDDEEHVHTEYDAPPRSPFAV